ncbi:MAG: hypothetical protein MJZ05_11915 [Fibrobacter sp.]|nr:hypothetical protein [Fibrobacter sp.]
MRKLLAFLFLAFAVVCSAQTLKPEFQAFSGALLKLKKADKGFHKFQLTVDVAPWAFQATGEVMAPGGDPDLLITGLFDGELYAVLAYVPSTAAGSDGEEYQVGFFDMMLYFEEEPTRIRNLKFKLLPPANDEWAKGILKDALESGSLLGNVWGGKFEKDIARASANPMDKRKLENLQKKKKKLPEDDGTIAPKKRRVEAEEEPVEEVKSKKKKKKSEDEEESSVSKKKKKKKAVEEDAEDEAPKKKKKKKKKLEDPCDDPDLSAKEKRRCRMNK